MANGAWALNGDDSDEACRRFVTASREGRDFGADLGAEPADRPEITSRPRVAGRASSFIGMRLQVADEIKRTVRSWTGLTSRS